MGRLHKSAYSHYKSTHEGIIRLVYKTKSTDLMHESISVSDFVRAGFPF